MDLTMSSGTISTLGDYSAGLVVQSIGAGGGQLGAVGMSDFLVSMGGKVNSTGDGGAITLSGTGDIVTQGALSHGAVVQSIGGGGGLMLSSANVDRVLVVKNVANVGKGGDITYKQTGNVSANGDGAYGLAIQSLGGGGGIINDIFKGSAGGAGTSGDINIAVSYTHLRAHET